MVEGSLRGDLVQTGVVAVAWVSTGRQGLQINIDSSRFFLFTGNFPPTTRSNHLYHFDWVEWFGGNFLGFFISLSNLGFRLELF